MVSEFERSKQNLSGKSIMVTSWYDDGTKNWRASAPSYAYLNKLAASYEARPCATRKAAIDRIIALLTAHMADPREAQKEHLLFL